MTTTDIIVGVGALAAFLFIYYSSKNRKRSSLPTPPGPKGLPLIGNIFDMPPAGTKAWETYAEWSKEYNSDVVSAHILGSRIIVLNSGQASNDLLDKRSSIYSGRPRMPMVAELMGFDWVVGFSDYGDYWRLCRRIIHKGFHPDAVERYHPPAIKAAHELLRRLASSPEHLMEHLRHMSGEIIMSATYGIDVQAKNDPYIEMAESSVEALSTTLKPGEFLVDSFPALKYVPAWMPGAGFRRMAFKYRETIDKVMNVPYAEAEKNMASGKGRTSFVSYTLNNLDGLSEKETKETIFATKAAAGSMYIAGADTTICTVATVILGLLSNPAALKEAQKQIDEVVGTGRLPEFADRKSLPYITALVNEGLRWNPATPLAVVHKLMEDDEYKGYFMPAGSIVVGNAWAILHEEEMYPEPFKFKPERFLKGDGSLNSAIRDPSVAAFGFGRRICPGRHIAIASAWIVVAKMVATFDITKAVDKDGKILEPSYEYTVDSLACPKEFPCSLVPRSKEASRLIQESVHMDA